MIPGLRYNWYGVPLETDEDETGTMATTGRVTHRFTNTASSLDYVEPPPPEVFETPDPRGKGYQRHQKLPFYAHVAGRRRRK